MTTTYIIAVLIVAAAAGLGVAWVVALQRGKDSALINDDEPRPPLCCYSAPPRCGEVP